VSASATATTERFTIAFIVRPLPIELYDRGPCARFRTAIDDFGAGYSGLNLLADLQTDFIKLDMALVRGIDRSRTRQAIVRGTVSVCRDLGIATIAEGVETIDELRALMDLGIELFQGYLLARPAFEAQAEVLMPPQALIDARPRRDSTLVGQPKIV